MSSDLPATVPAEQSLIPMSGLAQNQHANREVFKSEIRSAGFLPYIKLYGSNSGEVKEGTISRGHYGLTENQVLIDLGEEVVAIPVSWRWKAVRIIGQVFETFYNPENPEYQKVKEKSSEKDSGCMYGPEFLLWLPTQKKFVVYHMNNASARNEADNVESSMGKAILLKWRLAKNAKYKWEAPQILASSTPIAQENLPDHAELTRIAEKFANPTDTDVKSVDATAAAATDRAR